MLIRTSLLALDQAAQIQFAIGDGLDLWLDDRRLGARRDDREVSVRLSGETIPDDLVQIYVRGRIGAVPIDLAFDPKPNMYLRHVWDGSSQDAAAPGSPTGIATEIDVGWEMAAAFPRPRRTKWWRKPIVIGGIDLRSLGCGGITPTAIHQYDVTTDILWRGDGSRVANARARIPRHVSRLKVSAKELAVADGVGVHVFSPTGRFKRTLSALKGHEVASARADEEGRITAWTQGSQRYTIDRRNDNEALLRSPGGVWAVVDFDDRGRAVMVTDQDKSKATLEYTDDGGLRRVVDSAGLVTEMERDELGRVIRFSDSTGRQLELVRAQSETGSQVTVITAEGRETIHSSERREDGTYVESHSCCGVPNPRVSEYRSLGPLGNEQVVRTPTGMIATTRRGTRADKIRDIDVMRTSIVSPAGRTMSFEKRTERHRTGRTTETVSIGAHTSQKKLDPKTHTIESRSPDGRVGKAELVPDQELVLQTPSAGTMRIEFDANGRARRLERSGRTAKRSATGNKTDASDGSKPSLSRTKLSKARLSKNKLSTGAVNGGGNEAATRQPPTTSDARQDRGEVQHYGYDQYGRLSWSDFERWRQHIHHDEQGRVTSIETPDGWLHLSRDAAGRVSSVKAPSGAETSIGRRADGAISSITRPEVDGQTEREELHYDRDGLLVRHSFGPNHEVEYERDLAGRVSNIVGPDVKIAATYDEATGQLLGVSSVDGDKVHFAHDGDLQWLEEAMGRSPGRIERAFDDNHRVIERRINGGHEVGIVRNGDGKVTTVGPLTIERSVDAGHAVALQLGGLMTSREYDDYGRLSRHETRFGRMALVYFAEEIERDEFGRVKRITETDQGRHRVLEYTYNEARRLEAVTVDGVETMRLAYDSNGNIVELIRQGRALPLEVDEADRLIRVAGQPTSHDPRGNFTGIGENGAVRRYDFDGLGNVVASHDPHHDITHVLDALGRPIRIVGAGSVKRLLWDGDRLAATLDQQGRVDIRFVDSAESTCPEAFIRNGVAYLMVTDHLGSVRMVIDANEGKVAQSLTYDALGRPTVNSSPGFQPFGFAGGLHETVGGLIRFQARTYDPFVGRFLSRDPLGFAGGQINLYQYALGDPVNNIDPTGMMVAPVGEIHPCREDFIGTRPLAADHVYMRSRGWAAGMKPVTTLGTIGRVLSNWTADSTFDDVHCRTLKAVTQGCFDNSIYEESPLDGAWTHTDRCFGPEWNVLNLATNPRAWEFDPAAWDEGKTMRERLDDLGRLPDRIAAFRASAAERASTFIDSLPS